MTTLLVVISDLHVGSVTAICPDPYPLRDGGSYAPNAAQRWLNECWENFWKEIKTLRGRGKKQMRLVVVSNGDLIEGSKPFLIAQAVGDSEQQETNAVNFLQPIAKIATRWYGVIGTPAHGGAAGGNELNVLRALGAESNAETKQRGFQKLRLNVEGVKFDFAHHTGSASVPWTAGNAIRRAVLATMFDYSKHSLSLPDVVIRSHVHIYANTGDMFPTTGIVTPPWQLKTAFGWRVSPDTVVSEVGGLAFECDSSSWKLHKYLYRAAPPKELFA